MHVPGRLAMHRDATFKSAAEPSSGGQPSMEDTADYNLAGGAGDDTMRI